MELRFYPSYILSLELPHILVELTSAYRDDLAEDNLPGPTSPFGEQDHEKLPQNVDEDDRKMISSNILKSKQHDTCIPTLSGLDSLCCSLKPPLYDFERFTTWRLLLFSGTDKL